MLHANFIHNMLLLFSKYYSELFPGQEEHACFTHSELKHHVTLLSTELLSSKVTESGVLQCCGCFVKKEESQEDFIRVEFPLVSLSVERSRPLL